uniref:dUTP diphosphatase n=1 Tax=viral metagenome TaxID=1070528 RepID=A0A6C0J9R4_9ZZZZ
MESERLQAYVEFYGDNDTLTTSTEGSVGLDLKSIQDYILEPLQPTKIDVGIKKVIPPPGYFCSVKGRSSMGIAGLIPTSSGIIDNDYKGNIYITLINMSDKPYSVQKGNKVGQLIFYKYTVPLINGIDPTIHENTTVRGEGGFGSTGK